MASNHEITDKIVIDGNLNCYWLYFSSAPSVYSLNFSLAKLRIPALLKISSEQNTVNRLKGDIKQLNLKISQLQALLEEKEIQLRQAKRWEILQLLFSRIWRPLTSLFYIQEHFSNYKSTNPWNEQLIKHQKWLSGAKCFFFTQVFSWHLWPWNI